LANQDILPVLKYLCKALGVDLEAVALHISSGRRFHRTSSASTQLYEEGEQERFQGSFGWLELRVDMVWEAVSIAETLLGKP
jgi:hypothetical protein